MIIATLSENERRRIVNEIDAEGIWECLIAFDPVDKAFKFKINGLVWSPPMGTFQVPAFATARSWVENMNAFTAAVAHEWRKGLTEYPDACAECQHGNHEDCRDGTRISAVPYTCECARNLHTE